jgi:hypothetical protein
MRSRPLATVWGSGMPDRNPIARLAAVLKRRNRPATPGYYLCCRPDYSSQPFLVRLDPDFTMVGGGSVMPLSHCEKSALWSDEIAITFQ